MIDYSKVSWTKLSKKGSVSFDEVGAVMALYKNKGILFGGVHDSEEPRHGLKSVFHDDMFVLDLGTRKWHSLVANPASVVEV